MGAVFPPRTATRPLAIQKNGTWYTYGWDLTKNICETYRTDARIDLAYTYTPYGEVSPAHAYDQPLRWSSEYHDVELGLVYYNYRHYNPAMGRWMGRDMIDVRDGNNLFRYAKNSSTFHTDSLGLSILSQNQPNAENGECCEYIKRRNIYISATGNYSLITHVPAPTIQSLVTTINKSINKCECIKKLQIVAHANPQLIVIKARDSDKEEYITIKNAKSVFSQIKKSMCKKCTIYLDSCHLGLGLIPQEIANATGCAVRGACAYSNGIPGAPILSRATIRWNDEKHNKKDITFFEKLKGKLINQYKYFIPQNQDENISI